MVSVGLCAALRRRGLSIQPFKRGPDYIDPSWMTAAAGRNCRNLDTVIMPEHSILASFLKASQDADLAIIEGAMGLYDSFDLTGRGSTAHISRLLKSPVILVVNASHMTRSIAAMVSGYQHFESGTDIAGVILNNVAGSRHEQKLRSAIKTYCGIPVVGSLAKQDALNITERHLGLKPFPEAIQECTIDNIASYIEKSLNLDEVLSIAQRAGELEEQAIPAPANRAKQVKIGVIKDKVFSFYYPENLEDLESAGAELITINSLQDTRLPDIDALYIGGGFPELFLGELEANVGLRQDIVRAVEDYLPVYAECAGLIYLSQSIAWRTERHDMVGAISATAELFSKPQGHGYVQVEVAEKNPLFPVGSTFWGHEFHHSKLALTGDYKSAYRVLRGQGTGNKKDGIIYKNVLASYTHLHALGVPGWAEGLCRMALNYKNQHVDAGVS